MNKVRDTSTLTNMDSGPSVNSEDVEYIDRPLNDCRGHCLDHNHDDHIDGPDVPLGVTFKGSESDEEESLEHTFTSAGRKRANSTDTLPTSVESTLDTASFPPPVVPNNTPMTLSVADYASDTESIAPLAVPNNTPANLSIVDSGQDGRGNLDQASGPDEMESLTQLLAELPSDLTSPAAISHPSTGKAEGKARLHAQDRFDLPLLPRLFREPRPQNRRDRNRMIQRNIRRVNQRLDPDSSPKKSNLSKEVYNAFKKDKKPRRDFKIEDDHEPCLHFHEHSVWEAIAVQDCHKGLKRLQMLAVDLNKVNPARTVEDYYSEALGALIRDVDIDFDCSVLH